MQNKFKRKYNDYNPGGALTGPPTQRICKVIKCEDKDSSTRTPTTSPPYTE